LEGDASEPFRERPTGPITVTLFLDAVGTWELTAIALTLVISTYLILELIVAVLHQRDPVPFRRRTALPVVSVVIPVYNEPPEVLERTLGAWRAVRYPAYELILADDSDPPLQLNDPTVRVLHRSDRDGFKGGALRNAFEHLHPASEWMVIFDADYQVEPDVLVRFARHFAPDVGGVQGKMAMGGNSHTTLLTAYSESFHAVASTLLTGRYRLQGFVGVQGSVEAYNVAAVREIGGIAPTVTANEDLDTTFRMRKAGWRIIFDPTIVGRGMAPEGYLTFFSQITRWTATTVREYRRHWVSYLRTPGIPRREKADSLLFLLTWVNSLVVTPTLLFLPWAFLFVHLIPLWMAIAITLLPVAVFLLPTFDGIRLRSGLIGLLGYYVLLIPGYLVTFRAALLGVFTDPGFVRTPKATKVHAPAPAAEAVAAPPFREPVAMRGTLRSGVCRSCGRAMSHSEVLFYALSALDVAEPMCRRCLGRSEWRRFPTPDRGGIRSVVPGA
jgi:cellulose synthase/poly-beta-1,6-N-acetylglucosamine synthase-like glycosyltransferase